MASETVPNAIREGRQLAAPEISVLADRHRGRLCVVREKLHEFLRISRKCYCVWGLSPSRNSMDLGPKVRASGGVYTVVAQCSPSNEEEPSKTSQEKKLKWLHDQLQVQQREK